MAQICIPTFAALALLGFCIDANAQAPCTELVRLRNEAQQALKQSTIASAAERCYRYNRLSEAWSAVAQYANGNRDSCHVSIAALNEYERYHDEAINDRDNVCAGRPLRPYGADIIQH